MAWQPQATKIMLLATNPSVAYDVENECIYLINTPPGQFRACGTAGPIPPPSIWQDLDLTQIGVPENALAVDIRGLLIISATSSTDVADLTVSFQRPDGGRDPIRDYCGQAIALTAQGARTNASMIVPCTNGHINWAWNRGDNGVGQYPNNPIPAYPNGAAYGLHFAVHAVYLP